MADDKDIAFRELVLRQKGLIWHVCSDYSLSAAWEVEDAFQEVLLALWRDYGQFEGRSSERTWVYRVATSTMLMLKRKLSNQPQPTLLHLPEEGTADEDNYRALLQLIDRLEEPDRRIVRAHLDGFSNREVASIVGMSVAAVAMRLSRAKRKIRKQYENGL